MTARPTPLLFPALIATAVLIGCERAAEPLPTAKEAASPIADDARPWFRDATTESFVRFTHVSGATGDYLFPEIMGGGAALTDLDGDGAPDLYLVQSGYLVAGDIPQPGNMLYRNRADGTFEDVTESSGADDRGYGMGVAAGDMNNNGLVDLYVTNVGPNALLRNDGAMRFSDITAASNTGDSGWGTSAAFIDIDHDGRLDLFVVNYILWSPQQELRCLSGSGARDYCSPNSYGAPAPDVLLRNLGGGVFEDVSESAGLRRAFGNGLGIVCADFDQDGWTDVFVANDQNDNQLWRNAGDGTLLDIAPRAGAAVDRHGEPKAGMGTHVADFFGTGRPDLLVVNLRNQSDSFYRNEGRYFEDDTAVIGLGTVTRPFTRFGVALLDFNNDGYLDYFVANGRVVVAPDLPSYGDDPYAEPNVLLRGDGADRLTEVLPRGGTDTLLIGSSRAAAFGDINGDGAIDIVVVNRDGPAHVLLNEAGKQGIWIMFRALDRSGRDALHASLTIRAEGRRPITTQVRSAYSYQAANDMRVHVGLGERDAATAVAEVTVRWTGGGEERFGPFPPNQVYVLREGEGLPAE